MATWNNHYDDDGEGAPCPHAQCSDCQNDIIQIMPAPGWSAWYYLEEDGGEGEVWGIPLAGWALTRGGDLKPFVVFPNGDAETPVPSAGNNMLTVQPDNVPSPTLEEARNWMKCRTEIRAQEAAARRRKQDY